MKIFSFCIIFALSHAAHSAFTHAELAMKGHFAKIAQIEQTLDYDRQSVLKGK